MIGPGGILLVDKPSGVTSFQVADHVRRQLLAAYPALEPRRGAASRRGGPRPPRFKCGHAGTLDPLATGLLVVLVGKGSRLSPFLMGMDKTYAATVRFGILTDSLDSDGQVVRTVPVPTDPAVLEPALAGFRGEISQVPPLISALKRNGRSLYKWVRDGHDVSEPEARSVTIRRLELTDIRWGGAGEGTGIFEADLLVSCSSGTYIRSLARDLARAIGTEGHITTLRRLAIGPFLVDEAMAGVMDSGGEAMAGALLPLAAALPGAPVLELDEIEAAQVRQGRQPEPAWLERLHGPRETAGKSGGLFRMLDSRGRLVAVGRIDPETGVPLISAVIPATEPGE